MWQQPGPPQPAGGMEQAALLLKEIITPMIALLKPVAAPPPPQVSATAEQTKFMEGVSNLMIGTLKKVSNSIVDSKIEQVNGQEAELKPEVPQYDLAKDIVGLVKTWGTQFLSSKTMNGDTIKGMMKEFMGVDPETINDNQYNLVYNLACQDPEIGKSKIDKIFEKAGFAVPAENANPN